MKLVLPDCCNLKLSDCCRWPNILLFLQDDHHEDDDDDHGPDDGGDDDDAHQLHLDVARLLREGITSASALCQNCPCQKRQSGSRSNSHRFFILTIKLYTLHTFLEDQATYQINQNKKIASKNIRQK